jgi:polyribonucleotide nucleotidyltransferase
MAITREVVIHDRTYKFEFDKYAQQANAAVMVSCGGTQVLVTVCSQDLRDNKDTYQDFVPLAVDYIEKSYATGRIPGGYLKREGKPGDHVTLIARVLDRPLRPCFPKGMCQETVVTATVMSYEHGFSTVPLALAGASCALMISDIPFNGPVAGLRLGMKDGNYIIDPREGQEGDLDLTVACTPDAVLMVEAGAKFLTEEQMLDAISFAQEAMAPLFALQLEMQREIGKEKFALTPMTFPAGMAEQVQAKAAASFPQAFAQPSKKQINQAMSAIKAELLAQLNPHQSSKDKSAIQELFEQEKSRFMREMILSEKKRIDNRRLDEVRPISCEVNLLARPHGSALFTRGETQALAAVTLASTDDQQRSETLWDMDVKQRFMLHYNFPPFSVGEARMQRHPGRREIGHGSLARRALLPIIPDDGEFEYTIRLVSETLSSNGSSSMAAVCAGTMALLQAGVPIKEPVAGIAMGLIKEGDRYAVLSDILGDEDHLGDMDFKVCGTADRITALQMDIKIGGISKEVMAEALAQAKVGRQHILGKITDTISTPQELSDYAPRIFKLKIKQDKIRDIIGPGGKTIKKITLDAGVKIDIEESGIINIVAPDATSAQAAKALIRSCTSAPQLGEVYLGKAVRLTDFGVFVEIKPGIDGLCHISQLDSQRVNRIEDVVKLGDEVLVKVVDIDRQGRIKLSRKDAIGQKPVNA